MVPICQDCGVELEEERRDEQGFVLSVCELCEWWKRRVAWQERNKRLDEEWDEQQKRESVGNAFADIDEDFDQIDELP